MKLFKVRNTFKSNLYLLELFSKISLSMCVIIISLSLFIFLIFRNYGLEILTQSNKSQLYQISNQAKLLNNYAVTYTSALFNHVSTSQLRYNQNLSFLEAQNNISVLNNSLMSTPFVHSIYVYNGDISRYYCIEPIMIKKEVDFFDKNIISALKNIHTNRYMPPIPRTISVLKNDVYETINVYTYIIPEINGYNDSVRNALIVNVKADFLFNKPNDSLSNKMKNDFNALSDIMVLSDEGVVIGHSKESFFSENISDNNSIKQILNSKNSIGSLIGTFNNEKKIITYVRWENPKWTFVSVTPYSLISSTTDKLITLLIVTSLIFLVFSFVLSFVVSKKLYVPVNSIRNKIKTIIPPSSNDNNMENEFDFIMTELKGMEDQITTLETYKNKNIGFTKNELLKKLLTEDSNQIDSLKQKMVEFNINIDQDHHMVLFVLKIDKYYEFCSKNNISNQHLIKYGLMNITQEITGNLYQSECIDFGDDYVVVVVTLPETHIAAFQVYQNIDAIIKEIQTAFLTYFQISLSGFVSHICDRIEKITFIYNQVMDLCNYRIIFGHGCILHPENIEYIDDFDFKTLNSIIENLVDALKLGKVNDVEKLYIQMIELVMHSSYQNVIHVLSYLSSSIFKMLNMMEYYSLTDFNISFITFNKKINELETINEINNEYISLFRTITDKIHEQKSSKTDLIVQTVIDYINNNYSDNTLCLDSIAEVMKISSTHLSRLFRKQTTKTIPNVIKEVRLEKAREFLTTSSMSVEEILDMICWDNKKYFYTVFKKQYGTTPTEYRLKTTVDKSKNA